MDLPALQPRADAAAVFVSHGSPMLPLEPGSAGPMLAELGRQLLGRGAPRAVLVFSPHWMTRGGVAVGASQRPETLYDFQGFDPALRRLRYEVAGDPQLAGQVFELLRQAGMTAAVDPQRGLDHGAWVPLRMMFPQAEVPVVPLSMPWPLDAAGAWRLGRALAPLRRQGVLLLGSGSLTHNLYEFGPDSRLDDPPAPYVLEFVDWARQAVERGDAEALLGWRERAPHARRAHPSDEHLLPLHFALGAAGPAAQPSRFPGGVHYGMLSMDAWVLD